MADLATDDGHVEGFDPFAGPAILRSAPTTEAQREIWAATRISRDASLAYNESITLDLEGPVDLDALGESFADIVERHEALRSTVSDDGLTFVVNEAERTPARVQDFSGLPEADRVARCDALVEREVETPFDISTGPPFRLHLLRLADDHARAVLTAHHMVFDGWSTAVVLQEWASLYNARVAGAEPALEPPLSYCDYATDEIAYRSSDEHRADEDFWLARYSDANLPTLELPADRPRPRLRTFEARRLDVTLPPELVKAVRTSGAKKGASLFTTLLAGFDALLFRLSNQEDIVVGVPAAGQSVGNWQNLVGHCVNILPLRAAVDAELPFSDLVGAMRSTMLDAYEHQRMTFGSLVAQLPIPRDPSRPPLVSVVFNVDRGMPSDAIGFDGITATLSTNERHYENFDLFLNAVELPDGVVLECQYNRSLFDESTIRRWMTAFEQLLAAVAEAPDTPIGQLPLISDQERDQIEAWNRAAVVDHPIDTTFVDLFDAQVEARPDAVACDFDGSRLTYRDLDTRARQLAAVLRSRGVGSGDLVGLSVERSERMLIGLVGILRTGAGYVPLDPGFPKERLEYMVDAADIGVLVTETATNAELRLGAASVILLDDDAQFADVAPDDDSIGPAPIRPEDAAFVIFTSGSTGQPKGVQVPHRALANLLHSVARTPGMSSDDVVLAVTTLSFDIAVSELLLPLTVGARIVLASREVASDGGQLLELLQASGATFIDATPATYRLLFGAGFEGDPNLTVICTGEAMPMELGQRLVECVGSLWNGYGPTETTVWSSFHQVESGADRVLIGYPVDNTRLYVLDDRLAPTPIGVPGELYIAGRGLSSGYLGRPDLTAERFIADPFVGDGSLMYKTGDLARYMPDGQLECLGRNDHQVKIRGYRIELGEIEHVLDRHPSIAQSTVVSRADTPGADRLVAYVRPATSDEIADAELRDHLKRSLPDYMVPTVYVPLAEFPLTPSGKVDRKALPAPDPATGGNQGAIIEPRTETESLMAGLFQEALSVPRISVDDDFFALGGHSLLASQVLARLRQDHGISLSFRTIFEAPTVERLAAHIDDLTDAPETDEPARPAIERSIETGDVPLSVSQERLWLLEEMDPTQRLVHNLPAAWRLNGPVDLDLLQRSLDEIARRHGTLRTRLVRAGSTAMQRIEPSVSLPIEAIDLRSVPDADREAELMRVVDELSHREFDLEELPLFRSYLIQLADDRYVYHSVRHNLIWDGWSFDIFLGELTALYSAFQRGETSPLADLPVTYADYVGYQRDFLEGPEVAEQIDFWRQRLAGPLPEATLPTDRARPAASEHAGENLVIHLGRDQADALTALGREHGATLYMVLFAAFNVMLHRFSKERDLLVGTPVRARNLPELEGLIGPFINAVVLRTEVEPTMRFTELLAQVREVTLDSFSNEDMPLEKLGTRPPVVRTFFSFQDARNRPPMLGDVQVEQLHAEPPAAANDLMLWTMETPSDLLAVANYSVELYDRATIESFLDGFRALLATIATDPGTTVGQLPVTADGAESMWGLGRPDGDLLGDPTTRWLTTAAERASAPAIRSKDAVVTNADVQASAAAVAALLPAGDGPVGVHAPELADRVAATLACLAAGRPIALLAGDAPAPFVARQRAELGCDTVLATEGSDLGDQPGVVRFGPGPNGSTLAVTPTMGGVVACLTGDGQSTSRAALATTAEALADALGIDAGQQVAWVLPAGSPTELLLTLASLGRGAAISALSPRDRLDRCGLDSIDVLVAAPGSLTRYADAELAIVDRIVVVGQPASALAERLRSGQKPLQRLHVTDEVGLAAFVGTIDQPGTETCIGRPLYPAQAAVVDVDTGPCGVGLEGELFLATAAPAGAESLPVGPASTTEGLSPTGDLGRVRADGRFELRQLGPGRIEVMGARFDGDEVARSIRDHDAVSEAHVTSILGSAGEQRLTAYVRTEDGESITGTDLRRHLRDQLPDVMVPQTFVDLDEWPLAADGNLDLDRLEPPDSDESPFVPARSESERLLAKVWQDDLGVPRVGVHDNFFALGGHSLLCFKSLARVEEQTGARLSPRVMLLGSLEQAALELDAARGQSTGSDGTATAGNSPTPAGPTTADDATDRAEGRGGRLFRKLKKTGGGT